MLRSRFGGIPIFGVCVFLCRAKRTPNSNAPRRRWSSSTDKSANSHRQVTGIPLSRW